MTAYQNHAVSYNRTFKIRRNSIFYFSARVSTLHVTSENFSYADKMKIFSITRKTLDESMVETIKRKKEIKKERKKGKTGNKRSKK